ncbi:MAG TPA: fluoride efflux transporter CrcB [Niastella sp.]|nr:fluoride efflux transporter CrcB [Niastella sp.]
MMPQLLLVAAGGAAGSVLRFLCQRAFNNFKFPYGTFAVNIIGCLLIGMLWALLLKNNLSNAGRLLLMTGFCGGFTTFSAFTQESIQLLIEQRFALFLLYVTGSVAAGLLATFAGYKLIS